MFVSDAEMADLAAAARAIAAILAVPVSQHSNSADRYADVEAEELEGGSDGEVGEN